MYKVVVNLHSLGRFGHVALAGDEMLRISDKVQEKYGTIHYSIVSVNHAEPEEEPPVEEPVSRRITLYAVGENFKDALRRGHIRRSKTSATDVLRMVVRDSPDTVALGIFGFDVYVDETNNHWNA